jgi:hypothetical protein
VAKIPVRYTFEEAVDGVPVGFRFAETTEGRLFCSASRLARPNADADG